MKILIMTIGALMTVQMAFAGNICPNDRVVLGTDRDTSVGTVLEVFSNGDARIRLDGYDGSYIRSVSSLGKGIACGKNGICAKDRVLIGGNAMGAVGKSDGPLLGKVVEVFSNGVARIEFEGIDRTYIFHLEALSKPVKCSENNICVNDRVILGEGNDASVGTVIEVFSNQKARIKFDVDNSETYVRDTKSLGKGLTCQKGSC